MNQDLKLRYVAFLRGAPGRTNQQQIETWMKDLEACLEQAGRSASPESLELANTRAVAHHALITLSRRATGLDGACRQALERLASRLPAFVQVGKCRFTTYQFLPHAGPWLKALGHLQGKPGISALEVGSMEGSSACWLLENVLTDPSSTLTCVDTFDLTGQSNLLDIYDAANVASVRALLEDNIEAIGRQPSVTILQATSQVALRSLPITAYDFIYIDGSHVAAHVLEDAVLAWRLLKPDGVMTFDDYQWGEEEGLERLKRPKPAIDAFLDIFSDRYVLLERAMQVTIAKVSD